MAYSINKTDGSLFATVADGTINTASSLTFIGQNYTGYGEIQNENYFRLLESHASAFPGPGNPQKGQLWYNTTSDELNVHNGTDFKPLSLQVTSTTEPLPGDSQIGDTWYNETTKQLTAFDGTSYKLVGPVATEAQGETGAFAETVSDGGTDYQVTMIKEEGVVTAIISNDVQFTPVPAIVGFGDIFPGITVASGTQFVGDATNALSLNGSIASDFLSSTANDSTTGTLAIVNDGGLTIGAASDASITVTAGNVDLANSTLNGDLTLSTAFGPGITIDGVSGKARVGTPANSLDIVNQGYVDTALTTDIVAANIPLVDTGTYFTTDDVESALQEVGADVTTLQSDVSTLQASTIGQINWISPVLLSSTFTVGTWQTLTNATLESEGATTAIISYFARADLTPPDVYTDVNFYCAPQEWTLPDGTAGQTVAADHYVDRNIVYDHTANTATNTSIQGKDFIRLNGNSRFSALFDQVAPNGTLLSNSVYLVGYII